MKKKDSGLKPEVKATNTFTIVQSGIENCCVQFDSDDKCIAVGGSDGDLRIYSSFSGKLLVTLPCYQTKECKSITGLRYELIGG